MRGFYLLIIMLVFSPLFQSGNRPIPLLVLEIVALALAGYVLAYPNKHSYIPKSQLVLLTGLIILPLAHLIPLPFYAWQALPGHAHYAQALINIDASNNGSVRATSLVPSMTEYSWLAILPPVMVFLFTLCLPKEQIKTAVMVFLGMAVFQAILSLMQYGTGPQSILRFADSPSGLGTYSNRDHFAGFLEMALPLSLAMLTSSIGHSHGARQHTRNIRQKLAMLASSYLNQTVVYACVSVAILLGLIFTQSRAGNVLAMVVILLSTVAFSIRLGGKNVYGLLGTFTAISVMLAIEVGMAPVLNRFVHQDPLQDSRWEIFNTTITAIGEFFPVGSGIGTFNQVFPRFQESGFSGTFVNHAHNDYLEWVMEGGFLAAILILLFLVLYFSRWTKVFKRGDWKTFNFIQVGAGIGMFAMILHTFVDFNLHIPANQIYFAFLAALFFYQTINLTESAAMQPSEVVTKPLLSEAFPTPVEKKTYVVKSGNPFSD